MTGPNLSWNANYPWGMADDLSPRILLRRLNAVLEPTKQAVLDVKATLDANGVTTKTPCFGRCRGRPSTVPRRTRSATAGAGPEGNSWPTPWTT